MPPELNPTRLTVAPSAHKPNSNLDSRIVRHNSTPFINSSTTDLGTAETHPLDERNDFPLAANEAFPSINPATTAPEAFEAQLPVQHDEIPVGASAHLQSDETNHSDSVSSQDTSVSSMVPVQLKSPVSISYPETSKAPQQKASPVVALKAKSSKAKTSKKTPQKKNEKKIGICYGCTVNKVSNLIKTRS